MDIFLVVLAVLIIACFVLHLYTRQVQQQSKDPHYQKFQQVYLVVYLLAAGKFNRKKLNRIF
jgi:hypothetical protein